MKFGIIGAGGKIGQMRVQTVVENQETELVAVMDQSIELAKAGGHGVQAFDNIDEFLNVEMDAVIISTPAHVRTPLCLAAFERGLHVLSEKPLANTIEDGRKVLEAARNAGKALGGGFNMRYYPSFAFVKDVVQSGQIGEIDHVRVYGGHDGLGHFAKEWEYRSEMSGGGAMWDVGIHMTDLARFILGDITEVYGVATNRVWNVEGSEDNAMAVFRNPEGIAAIYQASWIDWKGYQSALEVYGTKGMVRGAYAPMQNMLITMDKPGGKPTKTRRLYPEIMVREKLKSWTSTAILSFADELKDFVRMARGETDVRCADGHAALRAIEVAAAVPQSQASRMPVALEPLGNMQI